MHVLIFAGGTVQPGSAVNHAIATADLVIAADSGALTAIKYGHAPAIVVGDFDSLTLPMRSLEELGCQIVRVAQEKDETDTELAVQSALEQGATTITLLGALGGSRFDHTLANVLLLADFTSVPLRLVDGESTGWLLQGPGQTHIEGQEGDLLSLLPLAGTAHGITTQHLFYALHNESLRFGKARGVSNRLTQDHAEVSLTSGILLIVHTCPNTTGV